MNNAYDNNEIPLNVICADGKDEYLVECTNLPDVKYVDSVAWVFRCKGENMTSILAESGIIEVEKDSQKIPFEELPDEFQDFVLKYYANTYGYPGEEGLS